MAFLRYGKDGVPRRRQRRLGWNIDGTLWGAADEGGEAAQEEEVEGKGCEEMHFGRGWGWEGGFVGSGRDGRGGWGEGGFYGWCFGVWDGFLGNCLMRAVSGHGLVVKSAQICSGFRIGECLFRALFLGYPYGSRWLYLSRIIPRIRLTR